MNGASTSVKGRTGMSEKLTAHQIAGKLAEIYEQGFGGKPRGRYRISMKHMRTLTARRRVTPEIVQAIASELFEMGYVLIDMETFFVVLAQRTFSSYRRVSDSCVIAMTRIAGNA